MLACQSILLESSHGLFLDPSLLSSLASALQAGSLLDSGGDTSVHVNYHWSVTNICIALAENEAFAL